MPRRSIAATAPPPRKHHILACCAVLLSVAACDARTRVLVGATDALADQRPSSLADAATDTYAPDAYNHQWAPIQLSVPGDVYGLWASEDGTRVWAAGRRAPMSPILWRFDGERFVDATPAALAAQQGRLRSLWGSASGKLWTANDPRAPWHFDGTSWRETSGLPADMSEIVQIRGTGETAWLAGQHGSAPGCVVARWDGEAWVSRTLLCGTMREVVPLASDRALVTTNGSVGTLPGAVWVLDAETTTAITQHSAPFHLGCPLANGEVLLLGYHAEATDWARWNASDGLLSWPGKPTARVAASCWEGRAFVVTQALGGVVLQADNASALVLDYPPDDATLEPSARMATSRTDFWLVGSSINRIWRKRRQTP